MSQHGSTKEFLAEKSTDRFATKVTCIFKLSRQELHINYAKSTDKLPVQFFARQKCTENTVDNLDTIGYGKYQNSSRSTSAGADG
jgi:hypothetical protein